MNNLAVTAWEHALTGLLISDILFAMQFYKYLQTCFVEENKQTHILHPKKHSVQKKIVEWYLHQQT